MSQPPYAGDQPQKQALVHARVPFDGRRGAAAVAAPPAEAATFAGIGSGCSGCRLGRKGSGRFGVTSSRSPGWVGTTGVRCALIEVTSATESSAASSACASSTGAVAVGSGAAGALGRPAPG